MSDDRAAQMTLRRALVAWHRRESVRWRKIVPSLAALHEDAADLLEQAGKAAPRDDGWRRSHGR